MKAYLFLWIPFFYGICHGQHVDESKIYTRQVELRHDNDFFFLTDRYYSSGLFITYRTSLEKGIFGNSEQLDFMIGQEVYTPAQTRTSNSDLFDRPYSGFSGIWSTWSSATEDRLLKVSSLLGIAGLNSGAGGFQRWYHRALSISNSPLWVDELNDSFHINLYLIYAKEWEVSPNPFGAWIALQPNLAFGSRDIFGETEAVIHFGRRNSIGESIAYERLGNNAREIYFAFRAAYRQVIYNGLIEGNLFGDNSPRLKNPENQMLRLGLDFNHRFDRNDYKVGIRYNSHETLDARGHIYVQFSYALSF